MNPDPSLAAYRLAKTNELASLGIAHKRKWASLETGRFVSDFTQTACLIALPAAIVPFILLPGFVAYPPARVAMVAITLGCTVPGYLKSEYYNDQRINGHKKAAMDICSFMDSASSKGEPPDSVAFEAKHCKEWPLMEKPSEQVDWRDIDWRGTMICEEVIHIDETRYEK